MSSRVRSGVRRAPYLAPTALLCAIPPSFVDPQTEFLAMTGLFGVLLSGVQTLVLEREAIAQVEWSQASVLFMIGYAIR